MPGPPSFPHTPFHFHPYYNHRDYINSDIERETVFSRQADPIIIRNNSRSRYPFLESLPAYTSLPEESEPVPEQRSFFKRFFLCCW